MFTADRCTGRNNKQLFSALFTDANRVVLIETSLHFISEGCLEMEPTITISLWILFAESLAGWNTSVAHLRISRDPSHTAAGTPEPKIPSLGEITCLVSQIP